MGQAREKWHSKAPHPHLFSRRLEVLLIYLLLQLQGYGMGKELGAQTVALQGTATPAHTKDPPPPFEPEKNETFRRFFRRIRALRYRLLLLKNVHQGARGQQCLDMYCLGFVCYQARHRDRLGGCGVIVLLSSAFSVLLFPSSAGFLGLPVSVLFSLSGAARHFIDFALCFCAIWRPLSAS